jgi:hypothetical protein
LIIIDSIKKKGKSDLTERELAGGKKKKRKAGKIKEEEESWRK